MASIPFSFTTDEQQFMQTLVDAINAIQPSVIPPGPPTNLTVTPSPGANIIQFTRSDGNTYALYRNTTPSLDGATRIDLGKANQYTDNVGAAGVAVWYWILAKTGQQQSLFAGPVSGTTAALNAVVVPPVAVAPSQTPTVSNVDNSVIPGHPGIGPYQEDL